MTKAEIIASLPLDFPDAEVARHVGTGIGYVRQIRRHGVVAMRESSRRHGREYRERNRVEIRAMQRVWDRTKRHRRQEAS